jgi:UDP-N-acetylglucosamine transferase subunit ALG13
VIFVTVGEQLPFDRLVRAVDQWARTRGRGDLFAQIGNGEYVPTAMEWTRFLEPDAFRRRLEQARVLVAHAGMGSILTALELEKPILILPRRAALREHRNDHQLATAQRLGQRGLVRVALDEAELERDLDRVDEFQAAPRIARHASAELLQAVREFVEA